MTSRRLNFISFADEVDARLLNFKTYEEYLDSFVEIRDLNNLLSLEVTRKIISFSYKSQGITLTREEFHEKKQKLLSKMILARQMKIASHVMPYEPGTYSRLTVALAERESWNRSNIIHSIIFIRQFTKKGYEISGYIDYAARLADEDWEPFFRGEKKLWPKINDLGYYHWRRGTVKTNVTKYYRTLFDRVKGGLLFQNRHDLKIVNPNPEILHTHGPGENTTKQTIYTQTYAQVEIYDHQVREKR